MEPGAHLPASVVFFLILSCLIGIFGGKGCSEQFGLSVNLSLIIRTLPKIALFFSTQRVTHIDSVRLVFSGIAAGSFE